MIVQWPTYITIEIAHNIHKAVSCITIITIVYIDVRNIVWTHGII